MKYCFWGFIGLFISIWGCKTSKPTPQAPPEPVILSIGDRKFTTDEFFQSFTKNQFSDDTSKSTDIREYLQLYTNLKLKVIAAQSAGKDTTAEFREEMASFRKQLAQPYLYDKVFVENLVAEAYERLKQEVSASHILIPVSPDASPEDTLSAYRAAIALRSRILQQEITFEDAATRFSKDALSSPKGGNLGYFTVFQTVYPFENAAYTAPVGKITDPIRTGAGYHLIKVNDRRSSRGKVQVAHILVRISPNATSEGKAEAKAKIEKAHSLLQQEAWEVVCRDYSDEPTTKDNGGILHEFGTGAMTPAFEEVAFSLKRVGDLADHIFQAQKGMVMFSKANFQGKVERLATDRKDCDDNFDCLNFIGSVIVPKGVTVTLFSQPKFQGEQLVINATKEEMRIASFLKIDFSETISTTNKAVNWRENVRSLRVKGN